MKKLDVMMDGLQGEHWYKAAAIDLSEVALAIDASGSGTCWKLTLKFGRELKVKPTDNDYGYGYGYTFSKLLADIERAKIEARTRVNSDEDEPETVGDGLSPSEEFKRRQRRDITNARHLYEDTDLDEEDIREAEPRQRASRFYGYVR